jgi:hypothetical protein
LAPAWCSEFLVHSPGKEQDLGWYLKKSFGFGPLRLNLSKSGIGASVGVKGLRVSAGPKGKQLNAGRGGLYYRASLNQPPALPVSQPEAIRSPVNAESADEPAKDGLMRFLRSLLRGR